MDEAKSHHTTRFCLIPLPDNFVHIQTDRFFIYRKVEVVHHFTKLYLLMTDNVVRMSVFI